MTVSGLGFPAVDGLALPAKFSRRRFEAYLEQSNLPSACPQVLHASATLDLEGFGWSGVHADRLETPDCTAPDKLCVSSLDATWFVEQ